MRLSPLDHNVRTVSSSQAPPIVVAILTQRFVRVEFLADHVVQPGSARIHDKRLHSRDVMRKFGR